MKLPDKNTCELTMGTIIDYTTNKVMIINLGVK